MTETHQPNAIAKLPDLDTIVGMAGTLRGTEVGGQVCIETGLLAMTGA